MSNYLSKLNFLFLPLVEVILVMFFFSRRNGERAYTAHRK